MDREYIGNNFYELMQDLGEDYTLRHWDGSTWSGKLALEIKTTSTYMLSEREYLYSGTATFPDRDAQTTFKGCYFNRQTNPDKTYLMVSTIPEPTDERIADVYVVQCNAFVSIGNLVVTVNEKGDRVSVPKLFAENVRAFFDSTLQKQRRSSDGNFEQTLYYMQIPARFGIAPDMVVVRKLPKYNDKDGKVETEEQRFRVESVDHSLMTLGENGEIYGIVDVQMSPDTRV